MRRIILLALLLLLPSGALRAGDDCESARELYAQAKELLNYHQRTEMFKSIVALCPSYAEAQVNLADAYENLGWFDEAETHYQEAMKLRMDLVVPYIGLGEVYLKTGRYRLAQEVFGKGLAFGAQDERLQAGLKVASERLKREKGFYSSEQIKGCLTGDEGFQLMCMCPTDHYSFLRKWICIPTIRFEQRSGSLTTAGRRQLDEVGRALASKDLSGKKWLVIGHADGLGKPEPNRKLAQKRAVVVKAYLVDKYRLQPEALIVESFGQNRPRALNETAEGQAENRRVEIVLQE